MFKKILFIIPVFVFGLFVSVADANHSWGTYHWGRTATPFTLQLGDNVSSTWDSYLRTTASDWSSSTVLDTVVKSGNTRPRTCSPTAGRVEVCNEKYGNNGWLGIAQIWVNGSHIVQGTVKMNDTYFNSPTYNTVAWKNLVMCQEVGHTFGLNHQDENFTNANLGTCMDYTNTPVSNQHPNQHDYDMLASIYGHTDALSTLLASVTNSPAKGNAVNGNKSKESSKEINFDDSSEWGEEVRRDGHNHSSLKKRDLGNGLAVFTFVTWAE